MDVVLSLDLSTTATGWSAFNLEDKSLVGYGVITAKVPGLAKKLYPLKQLLTCKSIAEQVIRLHDSLFAQDMHIKYIIIEEINSGKNRLGQKTLDICHGILWSALEEEDMIHLVSYMDSDGQTGWRSRLRLRLSDGDKERNKEAKKLNKKLSSKQQIPIITKKHLAATFVNKFYSKSFDVDLNKTDADICDSIGLGHAYLHYILK